MNRAVADGGKLALICLVSALVLGVAHTLTAPTAAAAATEGLRRDLARMAGSGSVDRESTEGVSGAVRGFHAVRDKGGRPTLYILRLAGSGYGGDLPLLAAYRTDGEILDVVLRDSRETPGMGKRAEGPGYMEGFIGRGAAKPVPVRKAMLSRKALDAVTGSTITFIGIGRALEEGASFVRRQGGVK